MRLPGESQAEFVLMLPMVPSQRQNMIAWLAARCDPPNYGKLIVSELPKDKLVYGPFHAVYGARVIMEETPPRALAALFKDGAPTLQKPEARAHISPTAPAVGRAREALGRYQQAMERLKASDWGGFGAELEALRQILEELGQ